MPPKKPFPFKPFKPVTPLKPAKPTKPVTPLKPQPMKPITALDRETQKILQLKEEIAQRFWELGQCLIRVHDQQLYSPGFSSFDRYLGRKGVHLNRSTAYRLMDVARNFSRFIARKHGQTKLLAAIELAKATPEKDKPVDVLAYQIEVRESGQVSNKTFAKASSREIKLAANRIKRRNQAPKPLGEPRPFPKPAWQADALRALRKVAPKAKMELTSGPGKNPALKLTLSGIPRSKLRAALTSFASVVPEA